MAIDTIAPGVLVVETSTADGKIGVIAGGRVALAVDAGIDAAEGLRSLEAASSLERAEVWLAYTHAHVDHALGGLAFRGHQILASPAIAEHMAAQLDAWAERTGRSQDALRSELGWPTIHFSQGGEVDLGGRRIRLLDTPGHAPGALCVLDPDAGILFGGDTIVTGIPPYFKDGNGAVMEETLRQLALLNVEILVPGHGDVVVGGERVSRAIRWEADYLARCRAHVMERIGDDIDAIVMTAPYDEFIGDHLPRDRHRMEWRHEQAIRLMHDEVMAGLDRRGAPGPRRGDGLRRG
jgi:glyoxylase-like metal-dependent hydrolase (beta-lactamase superfamily II)